MEDIKLGVYKHYKGNEYRVLAIATHSETLEKMVVEEEKYDEIDMSMIMEKVKQIGEIDYNILKLYLEGNTYIEIGEKLNLKPKSVSNYLQKIRSKLKKIDVYD